jgi:predicted Zn-dependent peptidase
VARDQTAGALATLAAGVQRMRDPGPSAEELAAAKAMLIRSQPRQLETMVGIVHAYAEIAAYRLPLDWLSTYGAQVQQVSLSEVRAAMPRPETMTTVLVGDLQSLQAPLLALGWGPIEVHDAKGKLLRTISPGP